MLPGEGKRRLSSAIGTPHSSLATDVLLPSFCILQVPGGFCLEKCSAVQKLQFHALLMEILLKCYSVSI